MMERCRLCGLQKELIDNLCERCREIERLMEECLDPSVISSNDRISGNNYSFGTTCDLDRSWMDNLPIKVYATNTGSTEFRAVRDGLFPRETCGILLPLSKNTIRITPHEYSFIISYELEIDVGTAAMEIILNNIIKLVILDALGKHHSLLKCFAYDGAMNNEGALIINYEILFALSRLTLDSQIQSLSSGKRIILVERLPWERLYDHDGLKVGYYSRYGVGIIGGGHDSGMACVPDVPMFRP